MWTVNELDDTRAKWIASHPGITQFDLVASVARVSQQALQQMFRHSRKPIESEMATAAAVFFQTFFVKESPLEFSPRATLVACMNLAAKTEEFHSISLSDLVNALPDAAELKAQVPKIEMRVLAALNYDLVIEQPWLIQLFWADALAQSFDDFANQTHLKVYDVSCDIMRLWQWTDAVLVFPLPKLATAVMLRACIAIDDQEIARRSPEEAGENLQQRMLEVMAKLVPYVDVEQLMLDIEAVVYRYGKLDKMLKDHSIEHSSGFQKLKALMLHSFISNS
jgi:hypothetical protein